MRQERIVGLFSLPKCERCSKADCWILALTVARWLDIWHMVRFRNHSRFTRAYIRCLAVAGRNWMTMGMLWRKEDTGNFHGLRNLNVDVVLRILWTRAM